MFEMLHAQSPGDVCRGMSPVSGGQVRVLYAEVGSSMASHEKLWAKYRPLFPSEVQQRVEAFRHWRDRQLCLLGRLLVCRALEHVGSIQDVLRALVQEPAGRPYVNLPGAPDFNIAHSGDYAVCASVWGGRVGVDIEKIREVDIRDFESFLPPVCWPLILASEDRVASFFDYWTRCEAVAKADGCGIGGPVREITFGGRSASFRGKLWSLSEPVMPCLTAGQGEVRYSCHVACDLEASISLPSILAFSPAAI